MIGGDLSHDCLYFTYDQSSEVDGMIYGVEQTIEYCFRPMMKKKDIINEFGISSNLTFDEMKKENITVENLLEWSSPIDLIERYENYLQTNQSSSNEKFYKCIVPWFGQFCQYLFDFNQTFSNIVNVQQYWKPALPAYSKFACYIHVKCYRYSSHFYLDWREICDGKIDCTDGKDEENCFELEINQCSENEYQCRNGMCVDKAFLLDDTYDLRSPECLDGSDEAIAVNMNMCSALVDFACEDTTCRYPRWLSCGDGTIFESVLPRDTFNCANKRDIVFNYFVNWNNRSDTRFPHCFKMLVCTNEDLKSNDFNKYCKNLCQNAKKCKIQILESCPSSFIAPTFPVWDGHVRLGYFSNQTVNADIDIQPQFVCYDKDRCSFLIPSFILENYTCIHIHLLNLSKVDDLILKFIPCRRLYQSRNETHCQGPNMLRCLGTDKCISHRRIMDGTPDCYDAFDESPATNSCALNDKYRFKCTSQNKCLSPMLVGDDLYQCIDGEDEHYAVDIAMNIQQLPFSSLCNTLIDMISKDNETDEMYCKEWPCMNQYTRCNEVWNCPKGVDEVNCPPNSKCPSNHHRCLFPNTVTMGCLHINYADDGIVDCLCSTDERSYWKSKYAPRSFPGRCWNITYFFKYDSICDLCAQFDNIAQLCKQTNKEAEDIIDYMNSANQESIGLKKPFSHRSSHSFPPMQLQSPIDEFDQEEIIEIPEAPIDKLMDDRDAWLCYRGILIRIGKNKAVGCLCPPNYYGDRCQYQNERISLTLRFRKENFHQLDIIGIVITLVDHTDLIHSHDQITYIPILDCNTKFNLHLLYQTRRKDMTKNYTINIDAYDKVNLTYLTSWTVSIPFIFMPVNRVSAQLTIPSQQNCHLLCNHKYPESLRNVNLDSCHCNRNLSDLISTIRHKCNCSSDSICVGFANNRSICLCSLNKTGPRCFLKSICENETCKNGGLCVSYNVRGSYPYVVCACPEGYSGDRCEQKAVSIDISFSGVKMNESLLLHYIEIPAKDFLVQRKMQLPRATMLKKIPYPQNTVKISMPSPFHLLFAQLSDLYYLLILQHNYTSSINFSVQISPSQHCPHIRQLFDEETFKYSPIRRIQYYHGVCKNHSDLLCFHDEKVFMCLCTEERHANCFHFNFNMTYDCQGTYQCENGAKCYQDHQQCPKMRICVCPECFYGTKCQFNVKHFGLSLDSIIGYHIYPNFPISEQSASVKISIGVSILMLVIVIICGTLSIWTFQVKVCRETGCGIYLYISSIVSIITICLLNLKLWFLILSQMNVITSNGFLLFNCITMDFLLRFSLSFIDWLYACVATERLFVAYLAVNFVKAKSKQAAKRVIIIIFVVIGLSLLHDPIHRRLFDDTEDKRTWCLVRYTHNPATYNTVIDIIHFIIPFSINLLSAIGIIVFTAKQRTTAGKAQDNLIEQLKKQFLHHKHLLISSIILVLLGLPRLIISFLPNCMISPREYQLYLSGYFISFIPPLLTFFIFVLTSTTYKKECYLQTVQKWAAFKRHFNFIELICKRQ